MPEYTALAILSVVATVAAEVLWLRTGIFRTAQYWVAMLIVYAFHVLVDGWLTKLSAPIVLYHEGQITGVRVPWDIPVEDYLFGFAMITLTVMLWVHLGDRGVTERGRTDRRSLDAGDTDGRNTDPGNTDRRNRTTTQETP